MKSMTRHGVSRKEGALDAQELIRRVRLMDKRRQTVEELIFSRTHARDRDLRVSGVHSLSQALQIPDHLLLLTHQRGNGLVLHMPFLSTS